MATKTVTRWQRSMLLAACVCVGVAGAAWADSFAYLYTGDNNFGVVDLNNGNYSLCGNSGAPLLAGLAEDGSGNIYGAAFKGTAFYKINPSNGALTLVGNASIGIYGLGSTENGNVYALDQDYNLYSVNTGTGATTEIGPTGLTEAPGALSTGSRKLYVEVDQTLYSVRTKKGKVKLIGGTGTDVLDGLVYTGRKLYAAADSPPVLYSVNKKNGNITEIGSVNADITESWGMAPAPSGVCPS